MHPNLIIKMSGFVQKCVEYKHSNYKSIKIHVL